MRCGSGARAGKRAGRLPFVTRGALLRLGVLVLVLTPFVVYGYFTMFRMPGKSYSGPLPPLSAEESVLGDSLRRSVQRLAGEIGERNFFSPRALATAAEWIEGELRAAGYEPRSESFEIRLSKAELGLPIDAKARSCRNLVAELVGTERPGEIVLLGAHYDSVLGSPGANDNASGVAALLEIARALRKEALPRTVRFVAFVNEEPPLFQTESMGSLVHARASRQRGDGIVAMLSLETVGYYRDERGTQSYPWPLSMIYPNTGNFIGFVGNRRSADLVRECVRLFRETARFPSEGGAVLEVVPGVGWSDHWSFWQVGYPGIMVTDTAPYRYPHYHLDTDTPDKLDYERLARVVSGLTRVAATLAR